ncbi:hypothetical protein BBF96_09335 [Anoxybacter fermentans]|uniref:Type II secretion system protein GspF domain-containing protein n=1 Tax=Anoxybacter fermentans TaxID=1323375 RepID=A0A3S9SZ63_9FIRM|nr:hypothetical protein BBF96_09335 [Anoxybacter fermentans]
MIYGKDENECLYQLRANKLYPIKIRPIFRWKEGLLPFSKTINYNEMGNFCRQFSTLLRSGLSIPQALKLLVQQKKSSRLQEIISDLLLSLEKGESLYQGFSKHETKLPQFFCSQIRAGEMTNSLDLVLDRLATYYNQEDHFRKKINQLLAYPLILLISSLGVICFLLFKVIPGFQEIYVSLEANLPMLTYCLMSMSRHLNTNYKKYMIGLLLSVVFLSAVFRVSVVKKWIILFQYRLPIWGRLKKQLLTARLARTLGLLLENGLEVLSAIELTSETLGFPIDDYLKQIAFNLRRGISLTRSLKITRFFPDIFLEMVSIGEESGSLAEMLNRAAEIYEKNCKNQIERFLTFLEPALLMGIALIVGIIIFAVMLPMFEMIKLI